MSDNIRIRMLNTVRPDFYLGKPGTVAKRGRIYAACSNKNGAISAVCDNGESLGVKPGEFEFIEAPEWILEIHKVKLVIAKIIPFRKT